jgi:EAL domain-containing protein (putative c-di-GMP-specific phosphodiesterase class I)/AmiR/NasT family two-component response regulator
VLVAEDDPGMRSVLEALLASDGALELVAAVADAEAAIEAARACRPDVCVLDVSMPGGGGPRAARGIRAACPAARLVALSGREDRATVVEMLRAGVAGYVVKGATADEILDAVRRTARGESALSRAVTDGVVGELSAHLARDEHRDRRLRGIAERVEATLAGGLLSMVFQPICDLRERRAVGFEALARFELEPVRGPDVWFAEAAEVGLLLELEMAAARDALIGLSALASDVFLSVNVSPSTLCEPALLDLVRHSGAGPRLVIEATEHAPIDDYDTVSRALSALRAEGVRVAVDDAGAGFASLRHIVRLAPEFIKIDGELTRQVDADRSQRALTKALIAFAGETAATIVAEGLETEDQVAALRELGVTLGQGYRLGRPSALRSVPALADAAPVIRRG